MDLPEAFLNRMKTQLGGDFAAYLRAMEEPPRRALRVNTLKIQPDAFAHLCDFPLTPSGVLPEAFFFPADLSIGRHPLHLAGLCYVQEPAAMLPVTLLDVRPGMRVLDPRCAPSPSPWPPSYCRSEGKDYVMHDGDVTLFRFNV